MPDPEELERQLQAETVSMEPVQFESSSFDNYQGGQLNPTPVAKTTAEEEFPEYPKGKKGKKGKKKQTFGWNEEPEPESQMLPEGTIAAAAAAGLGVAAYEAATAYNDIETTTQETGVREKSEEPHGTGS